MTTAEMIKRYDIIYVESGINAGRLQIRNERLVKTDNAISLIAKNKSEIIAYIAAEKEAKQRAETERTTKINGIVGLAEVRSAISAYENYRDSLSSQIHSGNGIINAKAPEFSVDEIMARYPIAAAYIKAESFYTSYNDQKSTIGKNAMTRIENGEDFTAVMSDMEQEWSDAASKSAYNN